MNTLVDKYQKVEVVEYPNQVKDNPLVSINLLTYNHVNYIKQCLDSILTQKSNFDYEILLGEDDSNDGTREICLEYARKYPNKIRLFLHSSENKISINGQITGRFNNFYNLQQARGKYIAYCDGDDHWTDPSKLQKQVDFLEANPDFAVCFHNAEILEDDNKKENYYCSENQQEITTIKDVLQKNYIPTASVVFRNNDLIRDSYEWFYNLPVGDWPLHILNATLGKIKYIPKVMSVYRRHNNSLWSSKNWFYQLRNFIQIYDAINSKLKYQFDQVIEDFIDQHINWRFEEALKLISKDDFELANEYFSGLISIFPNLSEAKLGQLYTEIKLNKKNSNNPHKIINKTKSNSFISRDYALSNSRLNKIKSLFYDLKNSSIQDVPLYKYSFLKNVENFVKLIENANQPEIWNIQVDEITRGALFSHPPSKLYHKIPNGDKGIIEFGICLHNECWTKPDASGGCIFNLIINQKSAFNMILDPVNNKNDRGIFFAKLDIPASGSEFHEVIFETKSIGNNNNYRWSLWIEPIFYV